MEILTTQLPAMMKSLEEGKPLGSVIVYCREVRKTIGLTNETEEECSQEEECPQAEESEEELEESEVEEEKSEEEKSEEEEEIQPAPKKRKVQESLNSCKKLVGELQKLALRADEHMDTHVCIKIIMLKVGDLTVDVNNMSYKDWKAIAEPAPYGDLVHNETVHDESVRNALQIKNFSIAS